MPRPISPTAAREIAVPAAAAPTIRSRDLPLCRTRLPFESVWTTAFSKHHRNTGCPPWRSRREMIARSTRLSAGDCVTHPCCSVITGKPSSSSGPHDRLAICFIECDLAHIVERAQLSDFLFNRAVINRVAVGRDDQPFFSPPGVGDLIAIGAADKIVFRHEEERQ